MESGQKDIDTILCQAVEITSEEERQAYLDRVCGDDAALRSEAERLISDHFEAGDFLEKPAVVRDATVDSLLPVPGRRPITEKPGTRIGPYKLLQQIGEGGMGVVYMAEQKEPVKRRVALKIIKPGMDTRQVIARFEAERQALAMMDHPNIAKVLDAGATESGRPYFVMELVNGLPVTKYCDEQHLHPKERLELFVPICQAVQHAHQKGIIHRDLKPSNILVAEYDHRAVPKIIDFGVAKATSQTLTEKTMFTQLGQIVGTLEYMSPEQAKRNQLDVDTRSDIYSLGVVLYELLTGETPFDRERLRSAAFDEMLRIIREEEPSKPSTKVSSNQSLPSIAANRRIEPAKLRSMIRGELDWIAMKALEKDRARRYETANGLARDVERYLSDEPVTACPPSAGYRFRKFARRQRWPLAAATAGVLGLLTIAVVSLITANQFRRLAHEKQAALSAETEAKIAARDALHEVERARDREKALNREKDAALYDSYVTQAKTSRVSRRPGQRLATLETLRQARRLASELDKDHEEVLKLRNEAIAAIGLIDLEKQSSFPLAVPDWYVTFDSSARLYSTFDESEKYVIRTLAEHREIARLPVPMTTHNLRRFTADGQYLAGLARGRAWAWSVARESLILDSPQAVDWPEPTKMSCAHHLFAWLDAQGGVRLFDLDSQTELPPIPVRATCLSLSPDAQRMALTEAEGGSVSIWDVGRRQRLRTLSVSGADGLQWSPSARLLACLFEAESRIVLWNMEQDVQCSELVGHKNAGLNACFTSDGRLIATASWDGTVRIWNPFTGEELLRTAGSRCEIIGAPERLMSSTTGDRVDLWNLVRSPECLTFVAADDVKDARFTDVEFLGRGPLLAAGRTDGLHIFNQECGQQVGFAAIGRTHSLVYHQATKSLITLGSAGVLQWPLALLDEGKRLRIGPPRVLHEQANAKDGGENLALGSDGRLLVAATGYDTVNVSNLEEEPAGSTVLQGHRQVCSTAISPDNRWIVTGTNFGKGAWVWDRETGTMLQDLWPDCESANVAVSPDGTRVSVCNGVELRLFEPEVWQEVSRKRFEALGRRQGWSPDGKLLVIASQNNGHLLDPHTGNEIARLTSPNNAANIESFRFSWDNTRLAIVYRHAVEVWNLQQVRKRLATMDLDWDLPELEPEAAARRAPEQVEFDLSTFELGATVQKLLDRLGRGYAITKRDAVIVDKTLEDLAQAIEMDPGNAIWRIQSGRLNWVLGRDEAAVAQLTEALDLEPDNADALYHRGRAYLWMNDLEAANQDLEAAVHLAPHDLGWAAAAAGVAIHCPPWKPHAENALKWAEKCIAANGNDRGAWHSKAVALYRLGRLEEAEQAIQRAIELGTRWLRPKLTLAQSNISRAKRNSRSSYFGSRGPPNAPV